MSKKVLIAGPWVGEFGWELFAWQGYVRALSRNFDETIIISRPSSKAIYEDFCTKFVEFTPPSNTADSYFMYNFDVNSAIINIIKGSDILIDKNTSIFLPRRIGFPPQTHHTEEMEFGRHRIKPEYIRFGNDTDTKYDYIFHARSRELRKEDNWSVENWNKLFKLLSPSRIACIGTKKESFLIDGADDLRDVKLSKVFDVLRGAKCTFGPSSGAMHLSSICGCPHVVWSKSDNFIRYTENWNPLKTPVLFDSLYSWHPPAEHIYEEFKKWNLKIKEKK